MKRDLNEIAWKGVHSIHVSQNDKCRAAVYIAKNLRVP